MAFGVGKSHIISSPANHPCPKCGKQDSLKFVVYSKYLKLLFIPLINLGKSVRSKCSNCGEILAPGMMPRTLSEAAIKEKTYHQIPVWHFIGIIFAIAILPTILSIISFSNNDYSDYDFEETDTYTSTNAFIANPEIGDLYEYTIERGVYSTMLVVNVDSDSVYVIRNSESTPSMVRLDEINISENYTTPPFGISLEALNALYEDHTIYYIERY